MTTTLPALTLSNVLDALKLRVKQASADFVKNPNATNWNVQTRSAFVYQQAHYFFYGVSRTYEQKQDCLRELCNEPNGNWGDVICKHALGETLQSALREHANCP